MRSHGALKASEVRQRASAVLLLGQECLPGSCFWSFCYFDYWEAKMSAPATVIPLSALFVFFLCYFIRLQQFKAHGGWGVSCELEWHELQGEMGRAVSSVWTGKGAASLLPHCPGMWTGSQEWWDGWWHNRTECQQNTSVWKDVKDAFILE